MTECFTPPRPKITDSPQRPEQDESVTNSSSDPFAEYRNGGRDIVAPIPPAERRGSDYEAQFFGAEICSPFEGVSSDTSKPPKEKADPYTLAQDMRRLSSQIDKDGDGKFSRLELAQALQDKKFTGRDAQVIAALYHADGAIRRFTGNQSGDLSANDLERLGALKNQPADQQTPEARKALEAIKYAINRVAEMQKNGDKRLFNYEGGTNPISPDAVLQGSIGDCYLLAAISSIANTSEIAIRNMIRPHKDGTYSVRFPGAPDQELRVAAPTEAELGLYAGNGKHGIWPAVLEKAYGEYQRRNDPNLQYSLDIPLAARPAAQLADGGSGESNYWVALDLLTGAKTASFGLTQDQASETRQQLDAALNGLSKREVIIATKIERNLLADRMNPYLANQRYAGASFDQSLRPNHMYSVLGFDPKGPDGGTITIRDPYGVNRQGGNGTIQISYEQMKRDFLSVGIRQPNYLQSFLSRVGI